MEFEPFEPLLVWLPFFSCELDEPFPLAFTCFDLLVSSELSFCLLFETFARFVNADEDDDDDEDDDEEDDEIGGCVGNGY